MDALPTLTILLVGITVVVGGILALRLHAFLALVLGGLAVASLTPESAVVRYALERDGTRVETSDGETFRFRGLSVAPGDGLIVLVGFSGKPALLLRGAEVVNQDTESGTIVARVRTDDEFKHEVRPGALVFTAETFAKARSYAKKSPIARLAAGFGSTAGKIGILIAMASIIGKCLLDSGAADRVVRSSISLFGEGAAPVAFIVAGFALGVPVFFDTVFYLMIPLGKAMRMRTGRNYLLYVLTIVAGATMAHSLVPPTPGPLFVAEELGVDVGMMILAGSVVGFFTASYGLLHATLVNRWFELPLRPSAELSLEQLEAIAQTDESELPPLWLSLLPILLPVFLIGGNAALNLSGVTVPRPIAMLADKNIALILAALVAMGMLAWKKRSTREEMHAVVATSLASGGVIILITAAGGAFGGVLKETGVASLIQDLPKSSPAVVCTLAFLITTAVRTAQGSATVAMITAVGILAGLAESGSLGFHPVYLALAIGCGSKPIAWMNDSGFWVITKMSGMTEAEGLKYVTPMTGVMGLVGLLVVVIGVTLFPMA